MRSPCTACAPRVRSTDRGRSVSHLHIPDGVLPVWLWLLGWVVALAGVAIAARIAERADVR
ncbi:MAG: hypothetical protein FDZ75_09080, partial [Actinobacteria bacterium]